MEWLTVAVLVKYVSALVVVVLVLSSPDTVLGESLYRDPARQECPVLDRPHRAGSEFDVAYDLPSETGTEGWGGKLSVTQLRFRSRLFNVENRVGGDLDAVLAMESRVLAGFPKRPNSDALHALNMVALELTWSQRFVGGFGFRTDVAPGLFSGAGGWDGDPLGCPIGLTAVKAFSPHLAVFAGATIYPGFDTPIDPVAGLIVAGGEEIRLQIAYPESLLEISPHPALRFSLGARMLRWPEYSLGKSDARERLRYEETRLHVGMELDFSESARLVLQGGYVLDRTFSFETGSGDVDLEDTVFVSLGFHSRL